MPNFVVKRQDYNWWIVDENPAFSIINVVPNTLFMQLVKI